jgi:hypothetical protein
MAIKNSQNFQVWGPSLVSVSPKAYNATPDEPLGYTDNNDLISFEMDIMTEPIMSTYMGNIPEQYVHLGTIGYLSMTLSKWNEQNIQDLIGTTCGGNDGASDGEGVVGTVGSLRMGVQGTTDQTYGTNFSLSIVGSSISSHISKVVFHNCIIEGRGFRRMDFGNKQQRIGLSIVCLPYSAGGDAVHTGSDHIYTVTYA